MAELGLILDNSPVPMTLSLTVTLPFSIVLGVLVVVFLALRWYQMRSPELDAIPTIGYSTSALSYFSTVKFFFNGRKMVQEGYEKYKPGLFKIPTLDTWTVVAVGHQYVDDILKAPDSVLSFDQAIYRMLQLKYTMGKELEEDAYHISVIRSQLTRNLGVLFDNMRDELVAAFEDMIPAREEWVKVPFLPTIEKIVCRTSNRIFIGVDACRNKDYLRLNIEFTMGVLKTAAILNLFPEFLKPILAPLIVKLPSHTKRQMKYIKHIIEERRQKLEELGEDWEDKPNDMLMWLMSEAKGEEQKLDHLARRLLAVNLAAIHTTSLSFTQAVYRLAANPEYMLPMREEVEAVVAAEGWSKAALQKMRRVDSFLREAQRCDGISLLSLRRIALQPFTFSNGVTVPAGTRVACASTSTHCDGAHYARADTFDGFRFVDSNDDGHTCEVATQQMVVTQTKYLPFSHGRHACPGRFFAANELKAMLAHIVVTYDVKFEDGKGFPPKTYLGEGILPRKADVLFRKRQA
ncbi:cytochrome P450 [Artomyces pyxidatus]|uniref:Cytochrome P450 n=1 Tax=Artomyces pyxidatus TaxID=48021 RepID=A0ACB8TBW4_9AGAM|nr:cytochrome P450 [Artomyces pyxidatus]